MKTVLIVERFLFVSVLALSLSSTGCVINCFLITIFCCCQKYNVIRFRWLVIQCCQCSCMHIDISIINPNSMNAVIYWWINYSFYTLLSTAGVCVWVFIQGLFVSVCVCVDEASDHQSTKTKRNLTPEGDSFTKFTIHFDVIWSEDHSTLSIKHIFRLVSNAPLNWKPLIEWCVCPRFWKFVYTVSDRKITRKWNWQTPFPALITRKY